MPAVSCCVHLKEGQGRGFLLHLKTHLKYLQVEVFDNSYITIQS